MDPQIGDVYRGARVACALSSFCAVELTILTQPYSSPKLAPIVPRIPSKEESRRRSVTDLGVCAPRPRAWPAFACASTGDTALAITVLAGIVVGGTSILGGEGAVSRTVIGVLFIALIGNGYILLGLDPLYEQITMGVILLAAVGLDVWTRTYRG